MKVSDSTLENAPLCIVVVNNTGTIDYANEKTSSVFGYSRRELVGQPLAMLLSERYGDQNLPYVSVFFGGTASPISGLDTGLTGLSRNGTEIPVEIRFAPLQTEAGKMFVVYIIDIKTVIERRVLVDEVRRHKINRPGLYIHDDG